MRLNLVTWLNLLLRLWDRDNLIERKQKNNYEAYVSKWTTSKHEIEKKIKKTISIYVNFSNLWLESLN